MGLVLGAKCFFCKELIGWGDAATGQVGNKIVNCHSECYMEYLRKKKESLQ